MGNSTPSLNQSFLSDWVQTQVDRSPQFYCNIWTNKTNSALQMEEYILNVSSKQQLQEEQRIHLMRQNHPHLVSSLYFKDQTEEEFCASNYKGKIYIERIPLTLQTITDIPFPDALHIYSQSLQGFHALSNQVQSGCFPISQQHIGINCQSVCKVWMNNKFNRNYPSRNQRIMEQRMVKMILDTVEENVDLTSLQGRPSPTNYIYSRAKTPSQVKFAQAINLLRNYANQFYGGLIPDKVTCVDKVGGAHLLSKNWQGSKNQSSMLNQRVQRIQTRNNLILPYSNTNQNPSNDSQMHVRSVVNPQNTIVNSPNDNNYTAFKREEPLLRISPFIETEQSKLYSKETTESKINTPNFKTATMRSSQVNFQRPIAQQKVVYQTSDQVRPAQVAAQTNQVGFQVYPNNNNQNSKPIVCDIKRSQVINMASPLKGSKVNFITLNSPRNEVRQELIKQRVEQITSEKGILIRPQHQPLLSEFTPSQQISKLVLQHQTNGDPVFIQQNFNQQPQFISQKQNYGSLPIGNPSSRMKKSSIIFVNSGEVNQIPNMIHKTQAGPVIAHAPSGVISNEELEKVNSKLVFIQKVRPSKFKPVGQQGKINRYNYQSNISSEQSDYSSSYYAFTSKLYNNEEPVIKQLAIEKKEQNKNKDYIYSDKPKMENKQTSNLQKSKYSISLDDGMSSMAFLNELKNMKFSSTDFKKPQNSFIDYPLTKSFLDRKYPDNYKQSYEIKPATFNPNDDNKKQQTTYQVDYENYVTTLTDDNNHTNDLIVIGQKINMVPFNSNKHNLDDESQFRMSYEYEEAEDLSGKTHYETQIVTVQNQSGVYQEQIYQQTDQQAVFNNYAKYTPNPVEIPSNQQNYRNQMFRPNTEAQYFKQDQENNQEFDFENNNRFYSHNSGKEHHQGAQQEEYKVDFDPEILADLQRLKGAS